MEHILLGTKIEKKELNTKSEISRGKVSHHLAEKCAITREIVLVAAIKIREKLPSQCATSHDWANTVKYHEDELFGKVGLPIEEDMLERVLDKAMKEGAIYRKK